MRRCLTMMIAMLGHPALIPHHVAAQESEPAVRSVAFSPDGQWLAVARSNDKLGDVTVWNLATQKSVMSLPCKKGCQSVAFAGDGKSLAVPDGKIVKLLEVPSGRGLTEFAHPDEIRALDLSGDGKTLVTACRDFKFRAWDVASGKEKFALPVKDLPLQISIHPDGGSFLMVDQQRVANIDLETGKPRFTLDHGENANVFGVLFSADGRWILTSDNHARVFVWDAKDGAKQSTFKAMAYHAMAYHPKFEFVASSSGWYRHVSLLKIRLREPSVQERGQIAKLMEQLDDESLEIREKASEALKELGLMIGPVLKKAAETSPSAEVRMRARWIQEQITDAKPMEFPHLPSKVERLAFHPSRPWLACGCMNGSVYVWDLESKKEIARLPLEKK